MSEHTPGPWRTDDEKDMMVRGADDTIVAIRHRLPLKINEANMHLIAAAPDMLAALRELLGVAGEGNKFGRAIDLLPRKSIDRANAAIAKAEGQS